MKVSKPIKVEGGNALFTVKGDLFLQEAQLLAFMAAIAKFEGFWITDPPSISRKNLNPGNLRPVGASTGFQGFPTEAKGWAALRKQILLNISRGLTLDEFFLGKEGVYPGYAPLGDNPADVMENYISFVADSTNMSRNIDLRAYFPDIGGKNFQSVLIWVFPEV